MAPKKRLFLLHTMPFVMNHISAPLEREFLAVHPDVEIQTMLDTSLLADTMAEGRVTPRTAARLLSYVREAEQAGAALLLLTCTSLGEGMAHVRNLTSLPTLCITEPLVQEALDLGIRIGIVGTLPTSPAQIIEPLNTEARRRGLDPDDLSISIEVVETAFQARGRGDTEAHDRLVSEAVLKLAREHQLDSIIFAQASMSGTVHEDPGIPVLKLGPSAFRAAGEILDAR
ncbi:MAG TPA: aspartate/glutamate racemase family protein [Acidimicrobiia bacterium]|nr:aspartate/glutamate racemase family protein [Acidimicrobiia bacterium]